MSKKALKEAIIKKQNGHCALSEKPLRLAFDLVDTDRVIPKHLGGIYTNENTRIVDPVEHMKRHGNYRERLEEIKELKTMVDGREQLLKTVNGINNRLLAMKRGTDQLDETTVEWLNSQLETSKSHLGKADRRIEKYVKKMNNPIASSAMKIKGLGAITIAYMLAYVDIFKANHASSLWAYCGYDKPSHSRYTKGESGGGNKRMRCVLFRMADSMIKTRSVYRDVYDREKQKLSTSEKVTKTRNTQGKLIDAKWKETKPSHRHGAAMRKMIKHFLTDWWFVHRTFENLETRPLYVQEKMGHKGIIKPEERGWQY